MPDSPQVDEPSPPADQKNAAPAAPNAQPILPPPPFPVPPLSPILLSEKLDLADVVQVAARSEMIIKRVLGRYERWNPVHPTAGAFWGMGLGPGCGVGAGCDVGFSVGVTLAGVGVGLPQPVSIKGLDHGRKCCCSVINYHAPFQHINFTTPSWFKLLSIFSITFDHFSYSKC
jgi:hypothetical protein